MCVTASPIGSIVAIALVAAIAWYLPSRRAAKRIKQMQEQLPDALALMAASVEGGQTFQRSIDMYRRDARPPLSVELDRVMAEVVVGSDLVVALENMAERSGVEDLKWAVEAVRIQQSTGGRLAPILHTLADFMRTRQEVRREVQTLSAEGRMSGYVLFAIPIFLVCALELKDPDYLKPMLHGVGLVVLIGTCWPHGSGLLDRAAHGQHQGLSRRGTGFVNAAYFVPLVGITLMAAGLVGVGAAAARSHRSSQRLDFIKSLGSDAESYAQAAPVIERVQEPLVSRVFGPVAGGLRHSLSRLYPSSDIDRVHADLLKAGLTGSVRAEEFVAVQVGSVMLGIGAGLVSLVSGVVSVKMGLAILFILPMLGGLAPSWWLRHRIKARREQVTNDLPDLLDLMCISVAAGLGLEQAMQVSCARFESPVCHELRLTLREMELGLSRHDALENMKLRTDIDDLVTFAVVLSQADLLGLPIGRVLQAQADEMRDKRRQRAREKAAKVPVKILFPLGPLFPAGHHDRRPGPDRGPDQARLPRSLSPAARGGRADD